MAVIGIDVVPPRVITEFQISPGGTGTGATEFVYIETFVTSSNTYQKRGYHIAMASYEYWRTNVRDDGPPSGNPLIDITVIGEIKNSDFGT